MRHHQRKRQGAWTKPASRRKEKGVNVGIQILEDIWAEVLCFELLFFSILPTPSSKYCILGIVHTQSKCYGNYWIARKGDWRRELS